LIKAGYNQQIITNQQSSYSAMLNIAEPVPPREPVPTIPESVNSNSQPYPGIPSHPIYLQSHVQFIIPINRVFLFMKKCIENRSSDYIIQEQTIFDGVMTT
jgi:hypothetical protein